MDYSIWKGKIDSASKFQDNEEKIDGWRSNLSRLDLRIPQSSPLR